MPLSNSRKVSQKGLLSAPELLGYSAAFKYLWMVYRQSALRAGRSFNITPEQFNSLINGDCAYCGAKPSNLTKLLTAKNIQYNGVDRINSSQGYIQGNLRSCCKTCNSMKSKLSTEEFVAHASRIASHQQQSA